MPTLFAMILCISPGGYPHQQCLTRDFVTLDACKAFVASAEATSAKTRGFNYSKGICVPIQGAR